MGGGGRYPKIAHIQIGGVMQKGPLCPGSFLILRGFAPNKLLIHPTARFQNKCECRLLLMNSL